MSHAVSIRKTQKLLQSKFHSIEIKDVVEFCDNRFMNAIPLTPPDNGKQVFTNIRGMRNLLVFSFFQGYRDMRRQIGCQEILNTPFYMHVVPGQ